MCWKSEIQDILNQGWLALDTETTGLNLFHGDRPYAFSCCDQDGNTGFRRTKVNPFTRECAFTKPDKEWLKREVGKKRLLVFHNAKFDVRALELSDTINLSLDFHRIHDTHLFSHVLRSNDPHGLKPLGSRYLNISAEDEESLHALTREARKAAKKLKWSLAERVEADMWMPYQLWPTHEDLLQKYSVLDAMRTSLLLKLFLETCLEDPNGLQFWDNYCKERELQPHIYEMERAGMSLRPTVFQRTEQTLTTASITLRNSFHRSVKASGFPTEINPNSPKQLQALLFDHFGLPIFKKTESDTPSTDKEVLKELLGHLDMQPIPTPQSELTRRAISSLLELRDREKSLAYVHEYSGSALREQSPYYDSRQRLTLRSSLNQCGTGTTRFSSSNVNIQNIDMFLRGIFGPTSGCYWVDNDYDNLEMRIFAYDSQEASLIEAFENNESVHMVICRELFPELARKGLITKISPEYKRTKNGNFAIIYGASPDRANRTYGLANAYDIIRKKFPGLTKYISRLTAEAEKQGYVTTLFGYRLYISRLQSYAASNYRIQGTAGGVLKEALRRLAALLASKTYRLPRVPPCRMVATVHDQIVTEVPTVLFPFSSNRNATHYQLGGKLVREIAHTMSSPGDLIGIPTPVSCALVTDSWAEGTPYELKEDT